MNEAFYVSVIITLILSLNCIEAACTKRRSGIVREGPSTSFSRIRIIPKYTPLFVREVEGNWFRVEGHDFEGWIFKKSISVKSNCMITANKNHPVCIGKKKKLKRQVSYNEGFKVLKKELGCNYVKDRYGKTFWMSSVDSWPKTQSFLINIK